MPLWARRACAVPAVQAAGGDLPTLRKPSPPRAEEILEQRGGLGFADAAIDLRPVVAGGRARRSARRSRPRRPWDRPRRNRGGGCARTRSPPRTWRRARASRRDRSRSAARCRAPPRPARIASISACAVGSRSASVRLPACAITVAVAHDHAADRHLAGRGGGARLVEREIHEGDGMSGTVSSRSEAASEGSAIRPTLMPTA